MEKQIIIKHKIIENVLLITDEKENDKIIYLNEITPDNKDNGLIIKSLKDKNYKVLLNMNEVKFNINEKIQRIKKEMFEYELRKPSENKNQSLLNFFIFLLQIKFYKEYILNKLFGSIPTDKYMFLKNTYRLENILIDYLINLEKANNSFNEDILKFKDFLYLDTDLKDVLFSFFKNIDLKTNLKKIIETYEEFNRTINYLFSQLQNNQKLG